MALKAQKALQDWPDAYLNVYLDYPLVSFFLPSFKLHIQLSIYFMSLLFRTFSLKTQKNTRQDYLKHFVKLEPHMAAMVTRFNPISLRIDFAGIIKLSMPGIIQIIA